MATTFNRGSDEPQLQRQNYSFDRTKGTDYSEDWKGINQAKMTQKWNDNVFMAQGARMTFANSMAELTLSWSSFAGGGSGTTSLALTQDRWEIPEPRLEKPIIAHPAMYDAFYLLGAATNGWGTSDAAIANYASRFQQGVTNNASPVTIGTIGPPDTRLTGWFKDDKDHFPGWDAVSSDVQAYLIRQYNRCLNGQTHYQDAQYALRHSTVAPSYWERNISDVNVNCVYTTAQLLSEAQDASLWYFTLPGRLAYKLNLAASNFISKLPASAYARPGYLVGWLKSPFGEASSGRNKIEIQGGYVLDQWPLDTYPAAV